MELRERVARKIAFAFTQGIDPDTVVVPDWPHVMKVRGGFTVVPTTGAPLWQYFLEVADAAIDEVESHVYREMGHD